MSSRRRNHSQNFDSLLDTMANVVGVLVVVLAITQMHIGEAVRRIQLAEPTDDPAETRQGFVAAMPSIRVAFGREVRRLERELTHIDAPTSAAAARIEAIEVRLARIDALQLSPEGLLRGNEDVASELEASRAALAAQTKEQARLEETALLLEMRLGEMEGLTQVRAHKVRLPDPRPAPVAATELSFFCRHDRVVPADIDDLTKTLNHAIRESASEQYADDPFSASRIVAYFQKNDVGDDSFRWELSRHAGYRILARLRWRNEEVGEAEEIFDQSRSEFRQALLRRDPRKRYVLFHVWSDSFPTYLHAREIAEELGFAVGWQIYDSLEEYQGVLTSHADPESAIPVD